MDNQTSCYCGSGSTYQQCCGPFHAGDKTALTAEALMRSRFTAYCLRNASYLQETWDAGTRPSTIDLAEASQQWQRLEIVRTRQGGVGDNKGMVEFYAYFIEDGQAWRLHERSRFVKTGGRWFYLDGVVNCLPATDQRAVQSKNAPCGCGSGKKFKRCCGAS